MSRESHEKERRRELLGDAKIELVDAAEETFWKDVYIASLRGDAFLSAAEDADIAVHSLRQRRAP